MTSPDDDSYDAEDEAPDTAGGRPGHDRFYVETLPEGEGAFELSGREAAHAGGARRVREGEIVTLFDGSGWDVNARVVDASPRRLVLEPVARVFIGPATSDPVVCATALPKGSREDILVSKCAEIGVSYLVPVDFERSVVHAGPNWNKRRERFHRLAVEAAKQSRASTVMETGDPVSLEKFLLSIAESPLYADVPDARVLSVYGRPGAEKSLIDTLEESWPFDEFVYLVGPEGGMTEDEEAAAAAEGFKAVRLGPTTLRIETACVAFAAVAATFLAGRA